MNLVKESWLPFKLKDGSEKVLPISAICDPQVVDFALPRADFQGAAYQLAIGLLQTVFAPKDSRAWHRFYESAPDAETLQAAFDSAAHAFNVSGEGPLFMQDFNTLEDATKAPVSSLLIEAPGGNGLKLNTDHFIKRGIGERMSLPMAVMALFTLQINAPSGGQGHRTGLRGGGPLTTLVLAQDNTATLWQRLWLNVVDRKYWSYPDPDLNSASVFPWLGATKTSEKKGSEIYEQDVHALHPYWAMPRRIRLELQDGASICQISGVEVEQFVEAIRAQNYGGNYKGRWRHPLTPYKWNPKKPDEEPLSAKGQSGGITYKIWDSLTLSSKREGQQAAMVVEYYSEALLDDFVQYQSETPRLWVFGYDMDNMKARGWYSSTLPLFAINVEQQEEVLMKVKLIQQLAGEILWHTRTEIKNAWFEKSADAKGDFSFIDLAFWQRSEAFFFEAVANLVESVANEGSSTLSAQQASDWLNALRKLSTDLFDEFALSELGSQRSMAKRIKSRQSLSHWLYTGKPIKAFIAENNIEQLKKESA